MPVPQSNHAPATAFTKQAMQTVSFMERSNGHLHQLINKEALKTTQLCRKCAF